MIDFATWKYELEELLCRILGEPIEGVDEESLRTLYAHGYSVLWRWRRSWTCRGCIGSER